MYRVTIETGRGEDRRGVGKALQDALDTVGPEPRGTREVRIRWTDGDRDFYGAGATTVEALVALIEALTAGEGDD
jgi:hypothetical protein